ncbi:hypothetical protein A2V82_15995 [candidate division KSB1 bacterium RBG_16_48_16]|nr:MAG: hypothetical protein A2V82_15995 [candidate division KSB1 bacterium RBG_16_48_16]
MRKIFLLPFCVFLLLNGQANTKPVSSYRIGQNSSPAPGLAGNGITDISASGKAIWFGTGHGLSRTKDSGLSFETFSGVEGMGAGSVSGLWTSGDTIWVATAGDSFVKTVGQVLDFGTGLSVSVDGGQSWQHFDQPGPTPIQNLTYDIAVQRGIVWITSFGGGLQKSEDWGHTWSVVPPDEYLFDPGKWVNHRAFSAIVVGDALYVGTAGGINKSLDGGQTWVSFNHTNQQQPISGNFIVALAHQQWKDKSILWAGTWKAEDENEFYAVSKSEDGGQTWQTTLHDEKPHNFAFDDSIVYVAAESGLYKSVDLGETWYLFPTIEDPLKQEQVLTRDFYSAYAEKGDLWAGSADGLARTTNDGYDWEIIRAFRPTGKNGEPRTYAYPNPFSPKRHNILQEDGYVRIQYNTLKPSTVTIKVFDFAMDLVTTILESQRRPGPRDLNELWNGKNDFGDEVANGVYFYSVDIENDGTYWGKILVAN